MHACALHRKHRCHDVWACVQRTRTHLRLSASDGDVFHPCHQRLARRQCRLLRFRAQHRHRCLSTSHATFTGCSTPCPADKRLRGRRAAQCDAVRAMLHSFPSKNDPRPVGENPTRPAPCDDLVGWRRRRAHAPKQHHVCRSEWNRRTLGQAPWSR